MMAEKTEDFAIALFGELFMADQLARNRISKALPKGMELSHFGVLNHLARIQEERTPAQLALAWLLALLCSVVPFGFLWVDARLRRELAQSAG